MRSSLILSPAKRARPVVPESRFATALRYIATVVGILVVVVGLADVSSRLAKAVAGDRALFDAFAPAAAISPSAVPPAASSSGPLMPARIKVPALGIDAQIEEVGRKADGSMGTPKDFMHVGYWSEGAKPGESQGSAVFDGHVNNALTKAGVFEHLVQIKKGDYVTVSDASGRTLVYRVNEVTLYDTNEAPRASIFTTNGPHRIVLITCDGEWVQEDRSFSKRLVVVASPA